MGSGGGSGAPEVAARGPPLLAAAGAHAPALGDASKKGTLRTTSKYRGVTHHVRTGRFEAHLWLQGKQLYLGGYDSELQAATAYDLAAIRVSFRFFKLLRMVGRTRTRTLVFESFENS